MTFTLATALLSALTGCTDRQGELLGQSIESLVEIPAGSFTMGCTPEQEQDAPCGEDEYPTREITLTQPFLMSAYEVTQYEYFVLMSEWPAASTHSRLRRSPAPAAVSAARSRAAARGRQTASLRPWTM